MDKTPLLPDMPVLTQERIIEALLHYMSEEISIETAAEREGMSDTALRNRIKNDPIHAESTMIRGYTKDGHPVLKTNMRLRWVAQDRDAKATGQYLTKDHKLPAENKVSKRRNASLEN